MVPASGNLWVGGQQVWLGPAISGRQVTLWVDKTTLDVLSDGPVHLPARRQGWRTPLRPATRIAASAAPAGERRGCPMARPVQGHRVGQRLPDRQPRSQQSALAPAAELAWWYQFYFATERGRVGYDKYRREFAKLIWQIALPKWNFDDATFNRSAAAFDNEDHVGIVIHNYRWRLGLAEGEALYDDLESSSPAAVITVPTITLEGDANGAPHPDLSAYEAKFSGKYVNWTISGGIGHNLPQETSARFRGSHYGRRQLLTNEGHAAAPKHYRGNACSPGRG